MNLACACALDTTALQVCKPFWLKSCYGVFKVREKLGYIVSSLELKPKGSSNSGMENNQVHSVGFLKFCYCVLDIFTEMQDAQSKKYGSTGE